MRRLEGARKADPLHRRIQVIEMVDTNRLGGSDACLTCDRVCAVLVQHRPHGRVVGIQDAQAGVLQPTTVPGNELQRLVGTGKHQAPGWHAREPSTPGAVQIAVGDVERAAVPREPHRADRAAAGVHLDAPPGQASRDRQRVLEAAEQVHRRRCRVYPEVATVSVSA